MKGNKEANGETFASCPSSEVRTHFPGPALKGFALKACQHKAVGQKAL